MANYPTSVSTDANLYVAVNNKRTALNGAITNSDTTITVSSTTGFPASGLISIENEVIAYASLNATQFLTCTRGFDGTTAASHIDGSAVSLRVVAAHHNNLKDEVIAIESNLNTRLGNSTTQILLPDGSVSAPSVSFSADPNTGIYRVGADDLAIATNGAKRVEVDSTGHVSVNVTDTNGTVSITALSSTNALRLSSSDATFATIDVTNTSGNAINVAQGNIVFATSGNGLKGTTTNDSASAGVVGEIIRSAVTGGTPGSTGQYANVTSISLTAGDWDVSAVGNMGGGTFTLGGKFAVAISAFSNNTTTDHVLGDNVFELPTATVSSASYSGSIPSWRVSISTTTTYYVKVIADYSAAPATNGRISARRVR